MQETNILNVREEGNGERSPVSPSTSLSSSLSQSCCRSSDRIKSKPMSKRLLWTAATTAAATLICTPSNFYTADAFSVQVQVRQQGSPYSMPSFHTPSAFISNSMFRDSLLEPKNIFNSALVLQVSSSPSSSSSSHPSTATKTSSGSNNSPSKNRINFYDLEDIVNKNSSTSSSPYKINVEAEKSSSVMERKIVHLLSDDDGEEDETIPDCSKEAAMEIAHKASYSKISEYAKQKANYAMQKDKEREREGEKGQRRRNDVVADGSEVINVTSGRDAEEYYNVVVPNHAHNGSNRSSKMMEVKQKKRRFTASVKETGVDTMSQYVKSMGSHELLPKESEILLGKQIQLLVQWESVRQELEEKLSSPPTFAQWSKKIGVSVPELKKQIRRSQRAKAALIEANLRLVVTVARQTVKKGRSEINFQDACQEGIIGLSRACEKFDPEKGFRFSTYAIWWIKREVRKNLLEQSRSVRLPASAIKKINDIRINERLLTTTMGRKPTDEEVAQKCNMTVEKVLFYRRKALDATSLDKQLVGKAGKGSSASGIESNGKTIGSLVKDLSPTPSEIANKEMLQNDVRRLIRTLSPREQAVIRLRFGLDDGTPRTLDYISEKFNVGKDRIRKIEAKALLKLRQPYRNQSVKCYISDL